MSFNAQQEEQKAINFLNAGRIEDALKSYKLMLRNDPKSRRLRKTVADLCLKLGSTREAEQHLMTIVDTDVKERQFKIAIPIYRELIKLKPKDHELQLDMANCLLNDDRAIEALVYYKKAVEMTQRRNPEIAQDIQAKIIALNPGELAERRTFAELLEAASWSDKASDAWKEFSEINRKIGKSKEAARSLEKAIQQRDNWETRIEAAQARFDSREPRKALGHLQTIYKDFQREPKVLALLATGIQRVHHEDKAKLLWLEAAKWYEDPVLKAAALIEAQNCGATEGELGADFEGILYHAKAMQLKLHEQDWCVAQSKVEVRFIVKTKLLLKFRRYEEALNTIRSAEGLEKRPAIFALLIESMVALEQIEEAIELLSNFKTKEDHIMEHIQMRLLGLGVHEEDSAELIDNDLLDDDLEDFESDDISESSSEGDAVDLLAQAVMLKSSGDLDGAMDLLNEILEQDPTNMDAIDKLSAWATEFTPDSASTNFGMTDVAFDSTPAFTDSPVTTDPFAASNPFATPTPASNPFATDTVYSSPVLSSSDVGATLFEQLIQQHPVAYQYQLVGLFDESAKLLEQAGGMTATILMAQQMIAQEKYRQVVGLVQDALDSTDSSDPYIILGLWELARAYSLQQRVRSTIRTLDEIQELDSSFRTTQIQLWREALNLLD